MSAVSPAEYETRIHALEKLNATLAAEADRARPVIAAARVIASLASSSSIRSTRLRSREVVRLKQAISDYDASQPK